MTWKAGEWRGRGERGRPPSVGQKSVINREVWFFSSNSIKTKSLKTEQRTILICRDGSRVGVWGAMVQNWIWGGGIIDFSCENFLTLLRAMGKIAVWWGPWPPFPLDPPLLIGDCCWSKNGSKRFLCVS